MFNESVLNDDLDGIDAAIAYWNDTIFIIGNQYIHSTEFSLFQGEEIGVTPYDVDDIFEVNMKSTAIYSRSVISIFICI